MMNLISRLKKQKHQLRASIENESDFLTIYENLELLRIYFELLDGEDNPRPIKVPGTTRDIFGKKFRPVRGDHLLERIAIEIRTNLTLCLHPQLMKRSENEYELPHSYLRAAIESLRVQIERWLILNEEQSQLVTNPNEVLTVQPVLLQKHTDYSSIA